MNSWNFRFPESVLCSPGNAVRHCSGEKGWLPPELFNCTTVSFLQLKAMVGTGVQTGLPGGGGRRGSSNPAAQRTAWLRTVCSGLLRQGPSPLSPSGPSSASGSANSKSPGSSPLSSHLALIGSHFFRLVYFPSTFWPHKPSVLFRAQLSARAHFWIFGYLWFFPDKAISTGTG